MYDYRAKKFRNKFKYKFKTILSFNKSITKHLNYSMILKISYYLLTLKYLISPC